MNKKSIIQLVKSVIREEIENDENALYVEYIKDMPGEEPFMLGGQKFQYVMAKYPSGKKDIGVYAFAGDVVYGYNTFRKQHNIAEASNIEPLSGDEMDLAAPGPRDRTEPSLSSKGAKPLAPVLLKWCNDRLARESNPANRDVLKKVINQLETGGNTIK